MSEPPETQKSPPSTLLRSIRKIRTEVGLRVQGSDVNLDEARDYIERLDRQFAADNAAFNDGRINRAQRNYFALLPYYLSDFFNMTKYYWRLVAALKNLDHIDDVKKSRFSSVPELTEHPTAVRLDNFQICVTEGIRKRVMADLERHGLLGAVEGSTEPAARTEKAAEFALGGALKPLSGDLGRTAVYGSVAPFAEYMALSVGQAGHVVSLGPVITGSDVDDLTATSLSRASSEGLTFDTIISTPLAMSNGMGLFNEEYCANGDAVILNRLSRLLSKVGRLIVVVYFDSYAIDVAGYGRTYGPESLERLTSGFGLHGSFDVARPEEPGSMPGARALILEPIT